jgi:hypothetical protein
MSKVPGNLPFSQPEHGHGATSTKKNPANASFKQAPSLANPGGKTTAKNKTNVPFAQTPGNGKGGTSTAKNPANVSFSQPKLGGSATMPKASGGNVGSGAKTKMGKPVAPSAGIKQLADVVAYRKKKYGA